MGTFIYTKGPCAVPEAQLPELAERMKELFYEGGMFAGEGVSLFGRKIDLLRPVDFEDGQLMFSYNYFEDDSWETAGYNGENGVMWSNKVGNHHFSAVVYAAYILSEFYSSEFFFTSFDGEVDSGKEEIGWLNYLFGENYVCRRIRDPWAIYEMFRDSSARFSTSLEKAAMSQHEGVDLLSLFSFSGVVDGVIHGVFAEPSEPVPGMISYSQLYSGLKNCLSNIKADDSRTPDEKIELLKKLWAQKMPAAEEITKEEDYDHFAFYSSLIDWRIVAKLVADEFELDFWALYDAVKTTPIAQHTPSFPALADTTLPTDFAPIAKISTSTFLKVNDDNRAFWWTPDGDITFSDEMNNWFAELRADFDAIMAREGTLIQTENFLRTLVEALSDVNTRYRRVYCFKNAFYEFFANPGRREAHAAVILLQELMERYTEEESALANAYWPFEMRTPGRMKIRRYLAVLANPPLRQNVLGF